MKVYHWKGKANFGDLLSDRLLWRFCGLNCQWATPEESELVLIGSILEHLPLDWNGVIAGAGKMHPEDVTRFPDATVLGVRGKLTADLIKAKNVVLGDPALLANELVQLEDKQYDLGLVPHWTDNELEQRPEFLKYNHLVIRVADSPLEVIAQIGRCKKIVSSSLHGIILADAFGIPRRIELAPRMITHSAQEGGLFKWQDYSSSIRTKFEVGVTIAVDRNIVVDKQSELFDMFRSIKKLFK